MNFKRFELLIAGLKLSVAIALLWLALQVRTPLLASIRSEVIWGSLVVSGGLLTVEGLRPAPQAWGWLKATRFLEMAIAAATMLIIATQVSQFHLIKQRVFNANPQTLAQLGQHFVVGYRDLEEVKTLVSRQAIGGVFITLRNTEGKSFSEIQAEINSLQTIRKDQNLPPLWIATDQEGGIVSRLSPPLTQLPQLATVIDPSKSIEHSKSAVIEYAKVHGQELSSLGINVNFAPVVDLNKGVVSATDKFSQIYQRAISSDPQTVAQVARWYCQTLAEYHVHCTLKHFPGLGRLDKDTHLESAQLDTDLEELTQEDWVPFQAAISDSTAFMMLGHPKLMAIDPDHPASFSKAVVTGILRDEWQVDNILITDDFSMYAVYGSQDGLAAASVKAINSGVDLVLIAYDTDLYYESIDALLSAQSRNQLNAKLLTRSAERLARYRFGPA